MNNPDYPDVWTPESEARFYTRQLRTSNEPRWQNLRAKLGEEGIRPEDAAVAYTSPDGQTLEEGLLVVRDGRVFVFTLDFGGDDPTEPLDPANGKIWDWEQEELDPDAGPDLRVGRAEIARAILDDV